jgi:hypothetical protein
MQPILTADFFRQYSGRFQFQFAHAGYSDAVKTADLIVITILTVVLHKILYLSVRYQGVTLRDVFSNKYSS